MAYTWKNKYKGRYFIKKGSDRYMERQQGYLGAQERIVDKKNNNRDNDAKKEQDNGKLRYIGGNTKEQYKGA